MCFSEALFRAVASVMAPGEGADPVLLGGFEAASAGAVCECPGVRKAPERGFGSFSEHITVLRCSGLCLP